MLDLAVVCAVDLWLVATWQLAVSTNWVPFASVVFCGTFGSWVFYFRVRGVAFHVFATVLRKKLLVVSVRLQWRVARQVWSVGGKCLVAMILLALHAWVMEDKGYRPNMPVALSYERCGWGRPWRPVL